GMKVPWLATHPSSCSRTNPVIRNAAWLAKTPCGNSGTRMASAVLSRFWPAHTTRPRTSSTPEQSPYFFRNSSAVISSSADVRFLKLDVTRDADRKTAARFIADNYGKLDVLVNNAGVLEQGYTTPSTVPLDVIRQTFETNVFALIALTQELLPLVKKSDAGR